MDLRTTCADFDPFLFYCTLSVQEKVPSDSCRCMIYKYTSFDITLFLFKMTISYSGMPKKLDEMEINIKNGKMF